ncbi:glycoside hydrolase [Verrucomicrobiales bacterium]|nr:glycoside hydrolase [Verrucomicrobiales bacterium]
MNIRAAFALFLIPSSSAFLHGEEPEPAKIQHVVAVENVCAWPNLTLLNDGTIIAIFHNQPSHGGKEGDIDCWVSKDGLTWTERSTVTKHETDTVRMNHAAGVAKNGDLVVLCSGWTNVKQSNRPKQAKFRDNILRSWVLRSADGGRTWKQRDTFPGVEDGWSELIPFGDIWTGDDGALHVSCYQGKFKDPTQSSKTEGWRSWHLTSEDDGWTWKKVSIIGQKHNETDIFPLGGKSWLAAARIDKMELIRSDDNGATWQEPVPASDRNEINGHLIRLADGRLLFSYGVRIEGRRGVLAKFSSDDGKTWTEPLRISHTADGGDCGYPSSIQLASGKIVTAWYSSESPQHTGYHLGVSVWEAPAK